jgi:uncharacterized repeat protein (TIGR02543 family)
VFTVRFYHTDGTLLKTQQVNKGTDALAPANPVRTGYTFTGWDKAFTNVRTDIDVRAQFSINVYTVVFVDFDGRSLSSQRINYGSGATAPTSPTRTGYSFTGWNQSFSFITSNLTITAQYTPVSYTLSYAPGAPASEVRGLPASVVATIGDSATIGQAPTRTGYTFSGWSLPTGGSLQPQDSYTFGAEDVVLTATWQAVFTVTYDANGASGSVPTDTTAYRSGDTVRVSTSPVPTRSGYTFVGWSLTQTGAAISSFTITADTTLYAQWSEDTTTVVTPLTPIPEAPVSGLSQEEIIQLQAQTGNPFVDLANGNVPLGSTAVQGAWSLLSLIVSLLALFSTLALVLSGLIRRRKHEQDTSEGSAHKTSPYLILMIVAAVVGVLTPVVWLVLDTLSQPMVWINSWTVFVIAFLVLHLALLVASVIVRRKTDKDTGSDTFTEGYQQA